MGDELLMRSGLFSNLFNSVETWIAVAYVVGMFMVLAFRPQQIAMPYTFRLSYIFFALYFIVPAVINAIIILASLDNSSYGRGGGGTYTMILLQLSGIAGRILLALSIVFALGSLRRHGGND